jgi:hypothetical protein
MTIAKCKRCGETIITTRHIEDKKNALCDNCLKESTGIKFGKEILYFAPREVVSVPEEKIGCGKRFELETFGVDKQDWTCGKYCPACKKAHLCPACQKKKDNPTESDDEQKVDKTSPINQNEIDVKSGSDIQSSKIFEDTNRRIFVEKNGIDIINRNKDIQISFTSSIPLLIDAINYYQEKWGKIER